MKLEFSKIISKETLLKNHEIKDITNSINKNNDNNLVKINEEIKSSNNSHVKGLIEHKKNFKTCLNAEDESEKENNYSYLFNKENVIVKKGYEENVVFYASNKIAKNNSKTSSNKTTLIINDDDRKNLLNIENKKNPSKLGKTSSKNNNRKKFTPLQLIKFQEDKKEFLTSSKKKNSKSSMYLQKSKKNFKTTENLEDKEIIEDKIKSKYTKKKDHNINYKEFQNLKNMSNLVSKVKSNNMRSIKIDFILFQQKEKQNKEKLIQEYFEEQNKRVNLKIN